MCWIHYIYIGIFTLWIEIACADSCGPLASTLETQGCLVNEYDKADIELNNVYRELRARLPSVAKEKLKSAQVAWIAYRDKDCEFQSSDPAGGDGLAWGMGYTYCLKEKTVHRTKELKDYEEW